MQIGAGMGRPASSSVLATLLTNVTLAPKAGLQMSLDAGAVASVPSSSSAYFTDENASGNRFTVGSSSSGGVTAPTYNGTPGALTSSEFWSFDGGDFFRFDGSNPSWVNNLHKSGGKFTIAVGLYATTFTGGRGLVGTNGNTNSAGFQFYVTNGGNLSLYVSNGSGAALNKTADGTVATSAWHFAAVSIDGAGRGFFYKDGAYDQVSAANDFSATYSSPSASAATYTMELGANGNADSPLANGSRLMFAGIWNVAQSKDYLDGLFALMRTRLGI